MFDNGRPHKAFMFGGPGPRGGVQGATQFLETTKRIGAIPGVEVHVQVHSWLASYPIPTAASSSAHRSSRSAKPASRIPLWTRPLGPSG